MRAELAIDPNIAHEQIGSGVQVANVQVAAGHGDVAVQLDVNVAQEPPRRIAALDDRGDELRLRLRATIGMGVDEFMSMSTATTG